MWRSGVKVGGSGKQIGRERGRWTVWEKADQRNVLSLGNRLEREEKEINPTSLKT